MCWQSLNIDQADLIGREERSPLFAMTYLALKARGAKDWRTHLGLSLTHRGKSHSIEYHHIFPVARLKEARYEKTMINEIANMAFIGRGTNRSLGATLPEQYLARVVKEQGKEALDAQCIPLDSALWTVEAYPKFLEYRRAALAEAINQLMNPTHVGEVQPDLRALMAAGESEAVEFKASARWDLRANAPNKALEAVIVKTVAGLLNARGGTLLIGVDDKGKAVGLEQDFKSLSKRPDRDGYQQFLVNLFSSSLGKNACPFISISFQSIDGQDICVLRIRRSPKPIFVGEGQQTRFFRRTGNITQELTNKESVEYISNHWPHYRAAEAGD